MNIATTTGRIAAVLAALGAMTAVAGVAQAESRPQSMSKAEYRALSLRSEALNQKYGLGQRAALQSMTAAEYALKVRSEALNEKYGLGPQKAESEGMTAAAYGALVLRSEALNEKYGLDKQEAASVTSQPANSPRGFAWGAFGIGAAAALGLALIAGGFFVRRQLVATFRGLTPRYRTT